MTALVLSGSIGSTAEMWEPQRAALARFDVVCVEHPGHGSEPPPAAPTRLADLGLRVLAELNERGVARASFLGLSLGGAVGMWLAVNAPERIERLVLACSRARFGDPRGWEERAATVRAHGMEAIVDGVLDRWFTPALADRARWRAMMASVDPEGYARCCEVLRDTDLRGQVARIEAPTLVVAGADDPSVPAEDVELLVSRIPGARLATVPGAHLPNIEHPAGFDAAVVSFLS